MPVDDKNKKSRDSVYQHRIMGAIIAAELIILGFFNLWPAPDKPIKNKKEISYNEDVLSLNEAVVTRQQTQPPPPPTPQAPVPVPNDRIIKEEITFENVDISELTDSLSTTKRGQTGGGDAVVSSPQKPPSVIRIVEATTPEAAQKADIKAEITVSMLVNKKGKVQDANIAEIKLFKNGSQKATTVKTIGYGITEATLSAALQWKFRPAQDNGKPVRAYSKQIFTFGF